MARGGGLRPARSDPRRQSRGRRHLSQRGLSAGGGGLSGFVRPVLPFAPAETRDFGFELVAPAEIQQQSEPSLTVGSIIFTQSTAPLPTLAVENLAPGPEPSGSPSAAPANPSPAASPSIP